MGGVRTGLGVEEEGAAARDAGAMTDLSWNFRGLLGPRVGDHAPVRPSALPRQTPAPAPVQASAARPLPHATGTPLPPAPVRGQLDAQAESAAGAAPKVFRFRAKADEDARIVEGYLTASSRERAVDQLFQRKLTPLEVAEASPERALARSRPKLRPVGRKALAVFTRQLAILYKSGIPLARALDALTRNPEDPALGAVLREVRQGVLSGFPLSKAMAQHPLCFAPEYCAMLEAAELAGTLEPVLDRLASNLERQVELFAKVRSVLNYPALVTLVAVVLNLAIFKWILPQFEPIFASSGIALPLLTAAIMKLVRWANSPAFWVALVAVPTLLVAAQRFLKHHPRLREPLDRLLLKVPLYGHIYHRLIMTEVFSIMYNLQSSGITVQRTLVLASKVANNRVFEKALLAIAERVKEGDSLTKAFHREAAHFTPLVVQMVHMGETTGQPSLGFRFLTDFYKAELEYILEGLAATLEPLLISIVGVMTGTVVMAVFLPIYRIVSAML